MRMAVSTCCSPSRFYNHCYLTGRDYTDAESDKLTGRVFSGAYTLYGERFYLISLQYSCDLEHIFPIVDAYFNLVYKLIPLSCAAPRLISSYAAGREYLKCQVRRTNGQVQPGFIRLDRFSMISYKSRRDGDSGLLPYITVYFNSNGADLVEPVAASGSASSGVAEQLEKPNEAKFPVNDSFKAIKVSDFLAENPGFTEFFDPELGFEQLFIRVLLELIKDEQH